MKGYKARFKGIWYVTKETFREYASEDTWTYGAALSYYTIFSLAPVLIIVIAVASIFFGEEAVTGQIYYQVKEFIGADGAIQVQEMVKKAYDPGKSKAATLLALGLLVFGATTVFRQLQSSLNVIWEVKPKPKKGYIKYLRDRILSFGLIITVGFLLLVSLVLNAALVALTTYLMQRLPDYSIYLFKSLDFVLSLSAVTLLFAMIFKFLPDAEVKWKDVWKGAFFTAVLFTLGRLGIGYYLGQSNIASTYGAAGSIVLVLMWVNYSSQILFLGANFTQVYARTYGSRILPAEYAVRVNLVEVEQKEDESVKDFEKKVEEVKEICGTEEVGESNKNEDSETCREENVRKDDEKLK